MQSRAVQGRDITDTTQVEIQTSLLVLPQAWLHTAQQVWGAQDRPCILASMLQFSLARPRKPRRTTKAADLRRRTRDIACDSHGIEEEIRAMVSSYMAPKDDEDQELAIGRLVCSL